MDIKSEKTFEEVVERIVALFRPQHGSDAREYDNSDHEGSNGSPNPTEKGSANHNRPATAVAAVSRRRQVPHLKTTPQLVAPELRPRPKKPPFNPALI